MKYLKTWFGGVLILILFALSFAWWAIMFPYFLMSQGELWSVRVLGVSEKIGEWVRGETCS